MSAQSTPQTGLQQDDAIRAIDLMLDELASMTEQDCTSEQFYTELLNRAVIAVSSEAAGVWTMGPAQQLVLAYQCQASRLYPNSAHKRYRAHRAVLSEFLETPSENPVTLTGDKEWQLVACQVRLVERAAGIIVIYHRVADGETVARAIQHFVAALAELAADFEKNRRIRLHDVEVRRWQSLNAFTASAYRSLNAKETAFHIANEGRVFLECDRCSVFRYGTFGTKLMASSGLSTVDHRSNVVRRLNLLAKRVGDQREPFFYNTDSVEVPRDLKKPLQNYLNETGATTIAVIPLLTRSNRPGVLPRPEGILIVEVLKRTDQTDLLQRCQLVSDHATSALRKANEYQSIPLRPVWLTLRWVLSLFGIRRLPITLFVAALLIAAIAPLFLLKADFEIEARGELMPVEQRNVFATLDGYVDEVHVAHGDVVKAGEPLVTLRVPDKRREIEAFIGEIQTVDKKIEGATLILNQTNPNDAESIQRQSQLSAELAELKEHRASLVLQRDMLEARLTDRVIYSPIAGQVVTWQVEKQLTNRPVTTGEPLLKVIGIEGDWEVELQIPDRKVGYVLDANRESDEPLPLRFVLETDPERRLDGTLARFGTMTEVNKANEPSLRATASYDNESIKHPRPGATVIARIDCGERIIGYVWLHDLIDEAHRRFFW